MSIIRRILSCFLHFAIFLALDQRIMQLLLAKAGILENVLSASRLRCKKAQKSLFAKNMIVRALSV